MSDADQQVGVDQVTIDNSSDVSSDRRQPYQQPVLISFGKAEKLTEFFFGAGHDASTTFNGHS